MMSLKRTLQSLRCMVCKYFKRVSVLKENVSQENLALDICFCCMLHLGQPAKLSRSYFQFCKIEIKSTGYFQIC